ncbi:hypothetical protein ACFOG5_10065 [Pedobacter fastidiosus]|uniref:Uncharacterized protein n=1 Tax=Pedobacter fastidiosus TaxID=2765361 RepID=A0ABR7KXJ8_9SPHI|nr:hypothetical protein [Pedobacter fastidiosus]MBC6112418.1 hypothetical protein [Pedobacter fastidiosus]
MKIIKKIAPSDLENILTSKEYMEDGGMVISSLNYIDENLIVTFNLFINNEKKNQWELKILKIADERFIRGWAQNFTAYSDHFLLYAFTDVFTDLYYNGKSTKPDKLLLDLYKSHLNNYYYDFPFTYGINEAMNVFKLCKDNSGMFARGSRKILMNYQECLAKHGIQSNFVGEIPCINKNLNLLVFGESYFIGEKFIFNKTLDY